MSSRELQVRRCAAFASLLGVCAMLLMIPVSADDGKPRYVSGSGKDLGDCLNKFRPCRTLDYAIGRSGKADYIRVTEGDYIVDDARKLLALVSATGRIVGGYSKYSAYSEQNARQKTRLIGIPPEFRERFEQAGFTVIVDRKGIPTKDTRQMRKLAEQVLASEKSHGNAPCVSNRSEGYACQAVSLLAHLSLQDLLPASSRGNDIWGFTDLNTNREYAVMGLQRGVAVVDVTDPQAPEQIAFAAGSPTTWRDIKIYQRYDTSAKRWRAYAYVTADAVSDYLMVLDLSNLPNGIEIVPFASDFTAAHNTYLLDADYAFGIAQTSKGPLLGVAGGGNGAHRLYSLSQPRTPVLSSVSSTGYAHDLASFSVSDARKNSQCFNAQNESACQVLADFNENTVDIWDVTDPSQSRSLASYTYENAAYVHSGWWTEDGNYLFVHDELDESNFGLNTTVRVFDMRDLRAPTPVGSWVGPSRAIDHNGFVRGNRYFVSNYSEGLTVLDITDPASPQRVGYFDTFPSSAETAFVGAWGVYPFFESGTIAVADINTGLYLLENETLASSSGSLAFVSASHSATEGDAVALSIGRTGGASGPVSVQLEMLHGSTQSDDAALSSQLLTWAAGDAANKAVTVTLTSDAQDEGLELLIVRLKAPQGGASVFYPDTARIYVADAGSSTRLRVLEPSISIDEARGKALITVSRLSSASGEARVHYRTLQNTGYEGFAAAQGELVWPSGDASSKTIEISLDAAALAAGESGEFDVEFSNAVGAALETQAGETTAILTANVSVTDEAKPPAPDPQPLPPPPSAGGGGGGSTPALWLAALGLLGAWRLRRMRRHWLSDRQPSTNSQR